MLQVAELWDRLIGGNVLAALWRYAPRKKPARVASEPQTLQRRSKRIVHDDESVRGLVLPRPQQREGSATMKLTTHASLRR